MVWRHGFCRGKNSGFSSGTPKHMGPPWPMPAGTHIIHFKGFLWEWYGSFLWEWGSHVLGGVLEFPLQKSNIFPSHQVTPSLPIDGWNGFVNTWQIVKKMPLIKNARWFKQWPVYTLFRGDDLPLKGSLDNPRKVTKNFSGAGVLLKAAHPDRAKKKQRHTEKICMNITSSFLGLIWTRWCGMFCHLTVLSQGG